MEILSLGEKIKRRRKELNMTLKDLAKDRITPGQISLVESRRSNPSMDLLEYLAESLNVNIEYLMESEESQAEKVCTYYEQIAEAYIMDKSYIQAEEYIEKALYYSDIYNLEYEKARILYLRGKIHIGKGELTLAQQYLLSSNVIFITNNKYEEVITTFLLLAQITLELKAYHSANSYLKQAEKVYLDNNIGDDFTLGEIYYYLAKSYFEIENIGQAMNYSFLAKEKFEKLNNKEGYAKTLLHISEEYSKEGDLLNAIKYSKKTLEVYKELSDYKNISNIENELGKLFYNFENIEESFRHFEIARDMKFKNNDESVVYTLINICKNYLKIKDLEACNKVLLQINETIGDKKTEEKIECYLIRYRMHKIEEKHKEAEHVLLDAFNVAKANDLHQKAGEVAIMLGKFYIDVKNDENAAKYLDEGVSIFRDLGILKN